MIILAELLERRSDAWAWADVAQRTRRGQLPLTAVSDAALPGSTVLLDVEWRRASWTVHRVVHGEPPTERAGGVRRDGREERDRSAAPTVAAAPSRSRPDPRPAARPRAGDLVIADVPFTNWPGARDRGRLAKARPCVVVAAEPEELRLRPVFGSNSAVRREGMGRRIRDWRLAGLRKPSYVAARDHFVPPGATSRPIGRLSDRDLGSLLG